jgi:hypothetical protein
MDLRLRECRLHPVGSGQGPVAGSCGYGDEPSGSVATELLIFSQQLNLKLRQSYGSCSPQFLVSFFPYFVPFFFRFMFPLILSLFSCTSVSIFLLPFSFVLFSWSISSLFLCSSGQQTILIILLGTFCQLEIYFRFYLPSKGRNGR